MAPSKVLDKVLEIILFILMAGVVIATFFQVLLRYVLHIPFGGSEEMILILFSALVFIGAAYGLKEDRHIRILILHDILPRKVKKVLDLINTLLIFIFLIALFVEGYSYMIFKKDSISAFYTIPLCYPVSVVPISAGLMLYYFIKKTIRVLKTIEKRDA